MSAALDLALQWSRARATACFLLPASHPRAVAISRHHEILCLETFQIGRGAAGTNGHRPRPHARPPPWLFASRHAARRGLYSRPYARIARWPVAVLAAAARTAAMYICTYIHGGVRMHMCARWLRAASRLMCMQAATIPARATSAASAAHLMLVSRAPLSQYASGLAASMANAIIAA